MDIYNQEFLRLISCLEAFGVKYLIIGGFAVNKYGFKRSTGDIDFFIKDDKDNRKSLIDALEAAGYGRFEELMEASIIAGYCEIIMDNGLYADLMTEVPGLAGANFEKYYKNASVEMLGDIPVRFIHYIDLLQSKKAAGRNKDLIDIDELEKINRKKNILFVCIENSNRSQMSQAFAKMLGGPAIEAYSSGSRPSGKINPKAIAAMKELGYDLTKHHSKSLDEVKQFAPFDAVVTMGCGDACPWMPSKKFIDWQIPDPKNMNEEDFRKVRDLISEKVKELLASL
mgnify:FL=1